MTEAMLEIILRRDRIIVAAALVALTALAWTYVLWLAADMDMGGMEMTGFRMVPAGMRIMAPALAPWHAIEFVYVFAMWVVMMIGMMTPSAAAMILIYARVGRQASARGKPFAATGWFATGYLLTWVGFALVATAAQWALIARPCSTRRWRALAKCSVGSFSLRPACTSGHRSRIY
jgi:predicted metal-binding membrane protein